MSSFSGFDIKTFRELISKILCGYVNILRMTTRFFYKHLYCLAPKLENKVSLEKLIEMQLQKEHRVYIA